MYPKIYLAIDNCVASKRWCEPAHWMKLFADCGVYYVEASADNEIDPLYTEKSYLSDWADAVLADAAASADILSVLRQFRQADNQLPQWQP